MTEALAGKVALITGASRGIGAEIARHLAGAGGAVVLAARRLEVCRAVADAIAEESGARTLAVGCDVADADQVADMLAQVRAAFGRLDILINNAGVIEPIGALAEIDPAAWRHGIEINLIGPFLVTRTALPLLRQSAGLIINVSSGAASRPLDGWSAYCAGKAGLAMLTRSMALELDGSGVRVIGFRPGVVDTEMQVQIRASGINPVSRLKRDELAPADEPARFVLWLCSGGANGLSGEEVDIRDPALRRRSGLA